MSCGRCYGWRPVRLPHPIAFVPGGDNATWPGQFMGVGTINVTRSLVNCCGTPTGISNSSPSMGGTSAMISRTPNMDADQTGNLANARRDCEDRLNAAVTFGSDIGRLSFNVGTGFRTAADDYVDSVTIAAVTGMGGATVGFAWCDNGDDTDGAYPKRHDRMDHWCEVLARRHHAGYHLQQHGMR